VSKSLHVFIATFDGREDDMDPSSVTSDGGVRNGITEQSMLGVVGLSL
jgi:hypothetical protein